MGKPTSFLCPCLSSILLSDTVVWYNMDFFVHVACIMDSSEWTFMKVHIVLNKVWAFFEDVEAKGGRLVEMWELVFIFIFLKIYFDKYLTFYLYLDIFESNMLLVFFKRLRHEKNSIRR